MITIRSSPRPERTVLAYFARIAPRVADVNLACEQLVANGVKFLGDIVDTGGCPMGFLYDPDRNVLILHPRYAPLDD
jgi:hypothetical protein